MNSTAENRITNKLNDYEVACALCLRTFLVELVLPLPPAPLPMLVFIPNPAPGTTLIVTLLCPPIIALVPVLVVLACRPVNPVPSISVLFVPGVEVVATVGVYILSIALCVVFMLGCVLYEIVFVCAVGTVCVGEGSIVCVPCMGVVGRG